MPGLVKRLNDSLPGSSPDEWLLRLPMEGTVPQSTPVAYAGAHRARHKATERSTARGWQAAMVHAPGG